MGYSFRLMFMQIFVIVVLFVIFMYIIKLNRAISYERRISGYSINSKKIIDLSIYEKYKLWFDKFILRLRPFIEKISLFKKSSSRYEKYLVYGSDIKTIDIISIKLFVCVLFLVVTVFAFVLQGRSISFLGVIINIIIGYYLYDLYLFYNKKRRTRLIKNEMLRAIIIMNNAFKAGKSTLQAVYIASEELPFPISDEFKKIYNDIKYGLSISTVFERFAYRNDIDEARYLSATLTTLNRTGGNIVKVFSSIEKTLFDKQKLDEELKNSTSGSNLVVKILLFVPFIFIAVIYFLSPSYFDPFFQSGLGYVFVFMIIIMFIVYVWFLNKVMKVDV